MSITETKLSTEETEGRVDPIQAQQAATGNGDAILDEMNRALTMDDFAEESIDAVDLSNLLTKRQHPFFGYNSRIITQRVYPRDPRLDHMNVAELMEYCRDRLMIHPTKMTVTKEPDKINPKLIRTRISRCDLKQQGLLEWIESRETLTFPTVSVVFCRYRRKPATPYSRAIRSFVDHKVHDVIFDKEWRLRDGKKLPGWFAIVQDHTVRAQIFFRFDPKKKGKMIVDRRFTLLKGDQRQLELLREVFLICQKTRRVIQERGIASSGETAEKELFGDTLPRFQSL